MKSQNCCSEIEAGEIMEWKKTAARVMMIAPRNYCRIYDYQSSVFFFLFNPGLKHIIHE